MPKLLHRLEVFTHRGIYTKVLAHRCGRCFYTQKLLNNRWPFHTEAFTREALTYTRLHTEAFRHRWFFRESQKLWHREAFTQRIFYTQKLLHTHHASFSTEAFTAQRSFWAQELFAHRRLYTQKLSPHTEAFTHRSFYTEKPLHTRRFPTEKTIPQSKLLHTSKIAILLKFLTFGHHFVRKGCIRRWKIAIFDVVHNHFAWKGLRLTL